ncbi:MAG: Phosphomannomutase [Devosia sp.]|nr:Phosphomannomutase [Devosia sp.]
MTSLAFGTSGLRGLVVDLTDVAVSRYTAAFVAHMQKQLTATRMARVLIGRDLRSSSPRITAAVMDAVAAAGMMPVDCGELPTPALALFALHEGAPAIMVTGSHIPDDRNGLKFYRPDGEIDKADELAIFERLPVDAATPAASRLPPAETAAALEAYCRRYEALGQSMSLAGLRLGVYQHSSVARDLLVRILTALGATCVPFARADTFLPVDTEAVSLAMATLLADWARDNPVDAIVSADGDGDRPLLTDASGTVVRGDLLGLLTAAALGADIVVTPITSSSAIELSGRFKQVIRTRVGSPYVIAGMTAAASGAGVVAGFEANGGFLLGTPIDCDGLTLAPLPTRDAVLPLIATLALARRGGRTVAELVAALPPRFTASDRLTAIPATLSGPLVTALIAGPEAVAELLDGLGTVVAVDATDGARLTLAGGEIVTLRASGNAPELRCYCEADTRVGAEQMLASVLERVRARLSRGTRLSRVKGQS